MQAIRLPRLSLMRLGFRIPLMPQPQGLPVTLML